MSPEHEQPDAAGGLVGGGGGMYGTTVKVGGSWVGKLVADGNGVSVGAVVDVAVMTVNVTVDAFWVYSAIRVL